MNQLPTQITSIIFAYIEDDITKYWKNYFTKNIIIRLDPKSYFSQKVIPELDKGWKEVALVSAPCPDCVANGYNKNNTNCKNCFNSHPCLNCYWYNDDPFSRNSGCNCDGEKEWISWNGICNAYPFYKKYKHYYDLLHSQEWLDYMELEYMYANI